MLSSPCRSMQGRRERRVEFGRQGNIEIARRADREDRRGESRSFLSLGGWNGPCRHADLGQRRRQWALEHVSKLVGEQVPWRFGSRAIQKHLCGQCDHRYRFCGDSWGDRDSGGLHGHDCAGARPCGGVERLYPGGRGIDWRRRCALGERGFYLVGRNLYRPLGHLISCEFLFSHGGNLCTQWRYRSVDGGESNPFRCRDF